MDLLQLRYFVRVAELGSFTRAAAALGVAQPALSRQVRLLELELRQTLLRRTGRGAVPTEAGSVLLEHGRGILHQIERAREALAQVRGGGLSGRVALGLPPSVVRVLAVPLMQAFRARMPEARLAISEGLSTAMLESLVAGRLDVAVLYNAAPQPEVEIAPLANEELLLIERACDSANGSACDSSNDSAAENTNDGGCAADLDRRAISLAELSRLPLVIPSQPNAFRRHVEATLASAGLRPNIAMEVDGVRAILDLVAGGAGCAVLSRQSVDSAPHPAVFRARRIRTPRAPALHIALFTAVSARRPTTDTQSALLAMVRTLVSERMQGGDQLSFS